MYAGDTALAKVSLATNGTNSHNFTVWKQDKISFDGYVSANNEVVITAPSKAVQFATPFNLSVFTHFYTLPLYDFTFTLKGLLKTLQRSLTAF